MMPNLEVKKITLEGKGRIEIFHFQAENVDSQKRGSLFFIGEMEDLLARPHPSYYLLNSLAATLKREYYSPTLTQQAQAFESALKKANSTLAEVPKELKEHLELAVLTLRRNQVSFSVIGPLEVLLIREGQFFRLSKQAPSQKPFFKNIVKGKVKTQDRIIISTSKIKPLLEHGAFVSRLIKRSFDRLEDYLKKEDAIIGKDQGKGLAILHIGIGNIPEYYTLTKADSFDEHLKEPTEGQESTPPVQTEKRRTLQLTLPIAGAKGWQIKEALLKVTRILGKLKSIKSPFNGSLFTSLASQTRKKLRLPSSLMPYSSKRLTALAVVITGAVLIVIGFLSQKKYTNTITPAQENLESSKKGEASVFLNPAPNLERVLSFSGLALSEEESGEAGKSALQMVESGILTKKKAFIFAKGTLLEADLLTKNIEPLLNLSPPLAYGVNDSDWPLFLTKEDNKLYLYLYNPDQRSVIKDVMAWSLKGTFIKSLKYYSQSIYILEGIEKQVVRYQGNNLLTPVLWIQKEDQKNLVAPQDLAIDGSIYILEPPKKVLEFKRGQKKGEIPLSRIVSNETRLKTAAALQNLYLFDPSQNLVLVLDKKTGKLAKEYTLSSLQKIFDILPDEETQELLVLTREGVFKITF